MSCLYFYWSMLAARDADCSQKPAFQELPEMYQDLNRFSAAYRSPTRFVGWGRPFFREDVNLAACSRLARGDIGCSALSSALR